MKRLACGALVRDCTTVLEANTEQELLEKVAEHARDAHGIDRVPEEDVRAHIETV